MGRGRARTFGTDISIEEEDRNIFYIPFCLFRVILPPSALRFATAPLALPAACKRPRADGAVRVPIQKCQGAKILSDLNERRCRQSAAFQQNGWSLRMASFIPQSENVLFDRTCTRRNGIWKFQAAPLEPVASTASALMGDPVVAGGLPGTGLRAMPGTSGSSTCLLAA